jgi:hypothetical protein
MASATPLRKYSKMRLADCVAKVAEGWAVSNYRIAVNSFLNQRCAGAPDLESTLLARALKILLQQYRHKCDVPTVSGNVCYRCLSGLNTDVARQPPLTHLRHWSVVE